MQYGYQSGSLALRLEAGEPIHESLVQVCEAAGIHACYVVSGIGMLRDPELGFLVAPGEYERHTFHGDHELLNLSGNIARYESSLLPHLHVTLSRRDHMAFGGHLFKALAAITVEVLLLPLAEALQFQRQFEPESRLPGLKIGTTKTS